MATRSGSLDPGAMLWVQRRRGLGAEAAEQALDRESGLLGLAGTADMKQVLESRAGGDEDARLAVAVYVHRLRSSIAAMAASLGGSPTSAQPPGSVQPPSSRSRTRSS